MQYNEFLKEWGMIRRYLVNQMDNENEEFDSIIIWMDEEKSLDSFHRYIIKHTTNSVEAYLTPIYKIDPNTLHKDSSLPVDLNDIVRVSVKSIKPIFYDPYDKNKKT